MGPRTLKERVAIYITHYKLGLNLLLLTFHYNVNRFFHQDWVHIS